jgi:hypothetical protein
MHWYWDHESWGTWSEFLVMEIASSERSNWPCNLNRKYFQCRMDYPKSLSTRGNWGQICSNLSLSREFWCSLSSLTLYSPWLNWMVGTILNVLYIRGTLGKWGCRFWIIQPYDLKVREVCNDVAKSHRESTVHFKDYNKWTETCLWCDKEMEKTLWSCFANISEGMLYELAILTALT